MKILGLIPARGGSKGIPKKNIRVLGDKPLIQYAIESVNQSSSIDHLIVSTDNEEIANVAKSLDVDVPFLRPDFLANDTAPTLPTILHALDFFEKERDLVFDAVCLIQTTYPFRKAGSIDQAVNKFVTSDADSLISVLPVPHEYNPEWVFVNKDEDMLKIATGREQIIPRRQELPPAYIRDGSIYITKTSILRDLNSLFGRRITYVESDPDYYINLDTEDDWKKAEELLKTIY